MAQDDVATWVPPQETTLQRVARISFWALLGLAAAVLVVSIVILFVITRVYSVSTPTMERTVPAGDRVLLAPGSGIRHGDVVVVRVPPAVSGTSSVFVKRVIGLPGDNVACCDSGGRVTVNGKPLDETYLYRGDPPSRSTFSVRLGRGEIWVMGDHRTISVDSRKWGPVPLSGVVGRVVLVDHGLSFTALHTPRAFVSEGLAPADTRTDAYLVLALLIAGSVLALLLLASTGITRYMIGQRSSPQGPLLPSAAQAAPDGAGNPPDRARTPLDETDTPPDETDTSPDETDTPPYGVGAAADPQTPVTPASPAPATPAAPGPSEDLADA
jgi:signal peptidase I